MEEEEEDEDEEVVVVVIMDWGGGGERIQNMCNIQGNGTKRSYNGDMSGGEASELMFGSDSFKENECGV